MADRSYLAGMIPPPTPGATVNNSLNLFDLSPDDFRSYLNELAAQGVNTDELMRQYRRANSPFAGLFDWAINSERDIANEGRTTAGAGLFSKVAGTTGMDALASTRIEPANFIAGLLSGGGQAVDAAGATLKGLIPASDMPMEALGTAGMAMTGGAAAPKPRGALGANSLRVYHGGTGDVTSAAGGRGAWFSETRDLADEYAFGGGSVNEFNITPQRPIEFLHAEQRRPIGDIISAAIENAGKLSDEAISDARGKISTLRERYGSESRPLFEYWNNDPDIADFFRTLGYDSISVAEKSGGPQTWAALTPDIISANRDATTGAIALPAARNEAERMARQILEMRAAGRAGDVTDAMMAQADPQYMFNNTPLPMDEASRMARAGEMGFDTRVYHGSRNDMTSMDRLKGSAEGGAGTLFSSDEARVANTYATKRLGSEGENVLPLLANVSNYGESGYKTPFPFNGSDIAIEQWLTGLDRFNRTLDNSKTSYFENAIRSARNAGQSGTVIRQVEDDAVSSIQTMPSDVHVTLDPTTIRSRFARFDPEFSHLANLNAANASPLAGILAMPNEEERNRQLGLLFGGYR